MSDYTQNTFYGPKDSLTPGDAQKKILGTELDAEFAELATVTATKYDSGDIADTATAQALTSAITLITPENLKEALEGPSVTLDLSATSITTTADATIGNDIGVSGNADFTGNADVGGNLDVTGTGSIGGTLSVTGQTTLSARLNAVRINQSRTGNQVVNAITDGNSSDAERFRWEVGASLASLRLMTATGSAGAETYTTALTLTNSTGVVNFNTAPTILGNGVVVDTRQVLTGDGLTGGADLSSDPTLSVDLASSNGGLGFAFGKLILNVDDLPIATPDSSADYLPFYDATFGITAKALIDDLVSSSTISRTTGDLTLTLDSDMTWTSPAAAELRYCVWDYGTAGKLVQVAHNGSTTNNRYFEFSPTSSDQGTFIIELDTAEIPRPTDDENIPVNLYRFVKVLGTDADESELINDSGAYLNYGGSGPDLRITFYNDNDWKTTGTYRFYGLNFSYWADA